MSARWRPKDTPQRDLSPRGVVTFARPSAAATVTALAGHSTSPARKPGSGLEGVHDTEGLSAVGRSRPGPRGAAHRRRCTERHRGRGKRRLWRRAARRHGRGIERRDHREDEDRDHRRVGRLSRDRPSARHLYRDLHAHGLPDGQERRPGACRELHGHRQRRDEGGGHRRDDHRVRRRARGRHLDGRARPDHGPRCDGQPADGPDDSRPGAAGHRHQPEPPRRRRLARGAADLHVGPRPRSAAEQRDGRRHGPEQHREQRADAGVLQRRHGRRGELPDRRHRRGPPGRRRRAQHDSARGRQPVRRRPHGQLPSGRVAGRQPDRPPASRSA